MENRTIATRPAWPSRLGSFWTEELSRAVVIVDARKIGGVSREALTAYLAMVTLAQLDPEAEPQGLETIMTLFADRAADRQVPLTLSDWDRAYLRGLYASPADVKTIQAQLGELERSLAQMRKVSR